MTNASVNLGTPPGPGIIRCGIRGVMLARGIMLARGVMLARGIMPARGVMLALVLLSVTVLRAEEGMWIPMLLEKYKIDDMQAAGLMLDAEDIYSINQDCLKDAVVIFGGGCTGEMISGNGLVLTNHHCGEGAIQSLSSVENDYLTHGYWAMDRTEELPCEGLSVIFLRYMEEVTDRVMEGIEPGLEPGEREQIRNRNIGRLISEATSGNHYKAVVRSFYYGNAYYKFVYEVFRDVRLVGAPPTSIGNFGGDTDNWEWPRHTGDFSLFRVYAGEDNMPADYHPGNIPYTPRKHLEISAGGLRLGDFTMVMGYPGSTSEYLYSEEVSLMVEKHLPARIRLRTARMEIMELYMQESDRVRIQYTSKHGGVTNAWKKWQGTIMGLERMGVVRKKEEFEEKFESWVEADGERIMKYDGLLADFARLYEEMEPLMLAEIYKDEAVMPVELFRQIMRIRSMMDMGAGAEAIASRTERFYKDYHMPIDRDIFAAMMEAYEKKMDHKFHPAFFSRVKGRYKGDYTRFARDAYSQSMFSNEEGVAKLLEIYRNNQDRARRKVEKDPLTVCLDQFTEIFMTRITPELERLEQELEWSYKKYMAARLEMAEDRVLYPDANFTMRVTYGKVKGYEPRDGIEYHYSTTLSGVIEKARENTPDYRMPEKLAGLYETKDFGPYGVNGTLPVCFVASNHTSGGNSGSPVLDAYGRLIGINFDRNWEGTMSDVYYDPSICRNIAVDIRYVLFIMDKYAGAGYLLDEMDITW